MTRLRVLPVVLLALVGGIAAHGQTISVRTLALRTGDMPEVYLKDAKEYHALRFSAVQPGEPVRALAANPLPLYRSEMDAKGDQAFVVADKVKIPAGAKGILLLGWTTGDEVRYVAIKDDFASARYNDWLLINASTRPVAFKVGRNREAGHAQAGTSATHRITVAGEGAAVLAQAPSTVNPRSFSPPTGRSTPTSAPSSCLSMTGAGFWSSASATGSPRPMPVHKAGRRIDFMSSIGKSARISWRGNHHLEPGEQFAGSGEAAGQGDGDLGESGAPGASVMVISSAPRSLVHGGGPAGQGRCRIPPRWWCWDPVGGVAAAVGEEELAVGIAGGVDGRREAGVVAALGRIAADDPLDAGGQAATVIVRGRDRSGPRWDTARTRPA